MTAAEVIQLLQLEPLPFEGGFFRQTYKCKDSAGARAFGTAIYYLVTAENFSALHRVKSDELFHFYAGGKVEMIQIRENGGLERIAVGTDLGKGERPQVLVPRNVWQGLRLRSGEWALMGTTVAPGFEYEDFELGDRELLREAFPAHASLIEQFTRA